MAAGQALIWNVGTNTSSGRLVIAGTANVNDLVSDGQINITSEGALNNSGASIVLGGGSRTFIGTATTPGGALNLSGQTLNLNGGLLVNNGAVNGTLNVNYGSLAKGAGVYDVVNVGDGGTFAPGNSPGIATAASVHFDSSPTAIGSRLLIELAGTSLGIGFDQLHVIGELSLGGTLAVSLIDGFMPTSGNLFDILKWGSLSGTFSSLQLPALSGGLTWNTSQLYSAGILSVQIAGDYNHNGVVDAADYILWRDTLGSTTNLLADGNGNGMIDPGDFGVWKTNFGNHSGPSAGSGSSAAVPEPLTLLLAVTACILLWIALGQQRTAR